MRFYADLHIHSRHSLATSKLLVPDHLDYWARVKGIRLLGTGDCIHPLWLATLKEELEPAEPGLFVLKPGLALPPERCPFPAPPGEAPRFLLTTEISTIYKRAGRVRKSHSLVLLPSFAAADGLARRLERVGNIHSDGRPILGLDARDLLATVLENDPASLFIPAHIWTPWFSVLGSKSGFDSVEECFGDLTGEIHAVETGLSSDPAMNRACSFLDRFQLVSNSDAHSPEKLGRNATILDCGLSWPEVRHALVTGEGLAGTADLFPQEGKYHFDGHRACGVRMSPLESLEAGGICPVCGKGLTLGVLYRVTELADRDEPGPLKEARSFIPLPELLGDLLHCGPGGKAVQRRYASLITALGPELPLLLDLPTEQVAAAGEPALAALLESVRERRVGIEPGYDGEFGTITAEPGGGAADLFAAAPRAAYERQGVLSFPLREFRAYRAAHPAPAATSPEQAPSLPTTDNPAQAAVLAHTAGPCRITAGPGSGKTRVLTGLVRARIANGVAPERILALTFSNRAAGELAERLTDAGPVRVSTLHKLGLAILEENLERTGRKPGFLLLTEEQSRALAAGILDKAGHAALLAAKERDEVPPDAGAAARYEARLGEVNAFDLADLIARPLSFFREDPALAAAWRARFDWILVDEYQDTNRAQHELVLALAGGGNPNLVVVGDPDQAIYGFRGSDATLLDSFLATYPQAVDIRLEKSYRCPDPVLAAARQILNRPGGSGGGKGLVIRECATAASEAEGIARTIEQMLGGVRSFSRDSGISDGESAAGITGLGDFAILCRTRAQFPPLAEALSNHGLSVITDSEDAAANRRTLTALMYHLRDGRFPRPAAVPEETVAVLRQTPADAVMEKIAALLPVLAAAAARLRSGSTPDELLRSLALEKEEDRIDPRAEAVSLITMHAAKGLEFRAVFLPGCAAGLLPFSLYGEKTGDALAEEERLFYVACTRTKEHLFASYAKEQAIGGRKLPGAPSPFLARIREALLDRKKDEHRSGDTGQQELGF